jgi:hypothetical protein
VERKMNDKLLGNPKTLFLYELPKGYNIQIFVFVYESGKILINQTTTFNIGCLFNIKKNYDTKFLTKLNKWLNKQIII